MADSHYPQTSDPVGKYFIALHPQMFRRGQPALIEHLVFVNGRLCFQLRYPDGFQDQSPVENEDFAGKGGLGPFYDIVEDAFDA